MIKLQTLLKTILNIQQHPVEATVYFSMFYRGQGVLDCKIGVWHFQVAMEEAA